MEKTVRDGKKEGTGTAEDAEGEIWGGVRE